MCASSSESGKVSLLLMDNKYWLVNVDIIRTCNPIENVKHMPG